MIKNILFDFGGVLFDIDYHKTAQAFTELGFGNFEEMFSQYKANMFFQKIETGEISESEFYERLKEMTPQPVTNRQLEDAWNAMFIGFRLESLNFLKTIGEKYKLYLLSNTNAIHYKGFSEILRETTPYALLESFFTKAYYSHEIHLRKPGIEPYEFVLKHAGINATETLFIDDSYTNLPNAEKLGIKTHLLLPGERIENIQYSTF
jgi:glucose-1-phosphatase